MALLNCVRLRISRSRTPTSIKPACCSAVFTGTKRIVGRLIASQSASASAASFLPRLMYGLTSCGAINFTECPNDCSSRAQIYDTETSRPGAVLLRPGQTPSGTEIRGHLRRLVRRIREHWPQTQITIRGDGHYGRPEVMEWCDENRVDFVFGLPGNGVLDRLVDETADDIRTRRALDQRPCVRGFTETRYQAKSWNKQ